MSDLCTCNICKEPIEGVFTDVVKAKYIYHNSCYQSKSVLYNYFEELAERDNNLKEIKESLGLDICNLCGETCIIRDGFSDTQPHGLIGASVSGGYTSTPGNGRGALDDGSLYYFSMCEFCIDWLFDRFKNKPQGIDYFTITKADLWKPARELIVNEEWRKHNPDYFMAESARRDKLRKNKGL